MIDTSSLMHPLDFIGLSSHPMLQSIEVSGDNEKAFFLSQLRLLSVIAFVASSLSCYLGKNEKRLFL